MDGSEGARGARDAHERLVRALDALPFDDAFARRPSLLPGWSVGHVLTHLARNADSHARMIDAVIAGDPVAQYPGGDAQRESEIEAGSVRDAATLLADVRRADDATAAAFARADDATWRGNALRSDGRPWPALDLPFLRWREVALHASDLGLPGIGIDIWQPDYVEHELRRQVGSLAARLPGNTAVRLVATDAGWSTFVMRGGDGPLTPVTTVEGTAAELLAWLVGRDPGGPIGASAATGSARPTLARWRGIP